MPTPLPIDPLLPTLVAHVEANAALVLEAPPGAGKTTRVPAALLRARGITGEIVVLEPRRIATRMAAARVAEETGTKLGELVGYTVRFDDVSSPATRLRFVTEGVLTRRLFRDRTLAKVSCVVLDEFHERHLHGDVALALLRRLQLGERPDLKLVVMSATLDATAVASHLGTTPVRSEGKSYPVAIEHQDEPDDRALELRIASAVRRALDEETGDVLVFLPGAAEIRRAGEACAKLAEQKGAQILPLHGELPPAEQDRAVRKSDRRKIILATNVAESSVTIDGVTAVVDSGLVRRAGFAAWSGLPTLRVEKTSRASAIQRAGRAGRTQPGRALRLYSRADFEGRPAFDVPEIARMDLAQTLLELRASGIDEVPWLDPPPPEALAAAEALLVTLGALDRAGKATVIGRELLRYPTHPRLARVITYAEEHGVAEDGCAAAAILSERDLRAATERGGLAGRAAAARRATERSDVIALVDLLREAEEAGERRSALRSVGLDELRGQAALRAKRELMRLVPKRDNDGPRSPEEHDATLAKAIAAGFADRVARRVSGRTLALAGGGTAELDESSLVRDAPFVACVDAESRGTGKPLVRMVSAIEPEWLMDLAPDEIVERDVLEWNADRGRVDAVSRLEFRGLALTETRAAAPPSEAAGKLLFEAATKRGGFSGAAPGDLAARVAFARRFDPSLPAIDEDAAKVALASLCATRTSLEELEGISLDDALRGALGGAAGALDRLAPTKITLRSTRVVPVRYESGKDPWIESRLQDFFGQTTTPTNGGGRFNVVVHLLAPNARAVQVTTDLAGFWARHYPTIRKELMRKYPRHAWPEDPLTAEPQLKPAPRRR